MGYEGGMHVIRDKDARDSGQGCTRFGTTIVFQRKMLYLCTVLEERLHSAKFKQA